jgi:hypothetical protein
LIKTNELDDRGFEVRAAYRSILKYDTAVFREKGQATYKLLTSILV